MLSKGIIIASMGFCGMMYAFIDASGNFGSKVPVVLFFLVVTLIGLIIEALPRTYLEEKFGEPQQGVG